MSDRLFTESFKMHDTYGFPLVCQLHKVGQWGVRLSLPHFYVDALQAGWSHDRIRAVIRSAVLEVNGRAASEEIMKCLEPMHYIKKEIK